MSFNRLLSTTFYPPKFWRLDEPLQYSVDLSQDQIDKLTHVIKLTTDHHGNHLITVPRDFLSDLASVPRFAWWFVAPFDIARPAVVHDYIYRHIRKRGKFDRQTRYIADKILFDSIDYVWPQIPSYKRWSVYLIIRMFGMIALRYGGGNLPDPTEYNDQ